jgi:hypothetical protein
LNHSCIRRCAISVACAHDTVTRFHCTDASLISLGFHSQHFEYDSYRNKTWVIIPSMGKARDMPFVRNKSQVCDFYTKLRFRMGRFTHGYRVLPVQNAGQHLLF